MSSDMTLPPQHLALLVGLFVLFVFLTPTCETYSIVPIVQFRHLEPVVLCYSSEKVTDTTGTLGELTLYTGR